MTAEPKPRLGISACLLGEKVRYDGGHKLDRFLADTFGRFVEWVPVCPEVECGLPVPRPAMRLVGDPARPRLTVIKTGEDHTERMERWATRRVRELEREKLAGFVFKSRSPSSGMERVKVYDHKGMPRRTGVGVFARIFMEHFPLLPVEEDGRLHDLPLRENFIERIFCLERFRASMRPRATVGKLVRFHSDHKIQLMAHGPEKLRAMGRLVARAKELPAGEVFSRYQSLLLEALRLKATRNKNVNALQHMQGYFKKQLSTDEKNELGEVLGHYKQGLVPLIVPVTLLQHFVRKYDQPYLRTQTFLNPHPLELKLRNHA
jgi:uncharacterized protein YbgA (DUF1722 family)/uncharacterized protein YbbK (DUF523 family)